MTYTHPGSYDEQTIRAHLIDAHRIRADRILVGMDFLTEMHDEYHAEGDCGHVHASVLGPWAPRLTEVGEAIVAVIAVCRQAVGELPVHALVERVRSDDGWRDDVRAAVRRCFEPPEAAVRAAEHRRPYVGLGADAARRSAQIDREEADLYHQDDPRRAELLASAEQWDQQARDIERADQPAQRVVLHGLTVGDPVEVVPAAGIRLLLYVTMVAASWSGRELTFTLSLDRPEDHD